MVYLWNDFRFAAITAAALMYTKQYNCLFLLSLNGMYKGCKFRPLKSEFWNHVFKYFSNTVQYADRKSVV